MLATLTGLGLSTAAGLNAFIPILVVGLLARYTERVPLAQEYAWMSNGWVLLGVAVLLAVEVVLDKVAVVDHINDAIQTVVRPAAGGAVFAASSAAAQIDHSTWMHEHPWVGWLLGIVSALVVHAIKATARPVVNTATAGFGTPVVSAAEDTASLGMSLVAVLVPVVALLLLIVFGWVGFLLVRKVRRARRRRRGGRTGGPERRDARRPPDPVDR